MSLKVNRNVGTISLEKNSIRSGAEKIRIKNWSNFGRSRPTATGELRDETPCRIRWLIRFVTAQTDKTHRRDHSYGPGFLVLSLLRTLENTYENVKPKRWRAGYQVTQKTFEDLCVVFIFKVDAAYKRRDCSSTGKRILVGFVWCYFVRQ